MVGAETMKKLTPKQSRFIEEYMVDLNATQAAIRAGYSKKTAAAIGAENLTKPKIAAEIEKRQAAISEKLEITQETVAQELGKIAFAPTMLQLVNATDKRGALVALGKLLGLESPAKVEVTGADGEPIIFTMKLKDDRD